MILRMIDPEINGVLYIENPNGTMCGVIKINTLVNYPSRLELPTIDFEFTTYLNVLGKDYLGGQAEEFNPEEINHTVRLLAKRIDELLEMKEENANI